MQTLQLTFLIMLELCLGNIHRTLKLQHFRPEDNTISTTTTHTCNGLEQYNVVYILIPRAPDYIESCTCTLRTSYTTVLLNVQTQKGQDINNFENVMTYKSMDDWTLVSQVFFAGINVEPTTMNITLNAGDKSFNLEKNLRIAGGTVDIICNKLNFTKSSSSIDEYFQKSNVNSNESKHSRRNKSLTAALITLFFLLAVVIVIGIILFMLYKQRKLCIKVNKAGNYKCKDETEIKRNNSRSADHNEEMEDKTGNTIELNVINNHLSIEDAFRSGNMEDKNYQNQKHVNNAEPATGGSLFDNI